ncbi:S1 family peptidase [Geminicoccus roseus]|uniref:S1 family peptidase n=1 Tax=Geminicoccus roseus TaxID=404900 RepID=UPI00146FBC18|nr:serine protease [Geminicoccus roseus]
MSQDGAPSPQASATRRRPRGVLVACILAALVLGSFLIPGVLLYPGPRLSPEERVLIALQKEANQALAHQVGQMRQDLSGEVCVADSRLLRPGPGGAAVPASDAEAQALLPPPVERIAAPPANGKGTKPSAPERSLADLLDEATVLVIARKATGTGFGTGFFVAPGLIATNLHVVGDPPAPEVWVTSKALDRVTRARLVARSERIEVGAPDFALLQIDDDEAIPPLSLASPAERLQNVIASGFPALVMDTDAGFRRLRQGELDAVPEMAVSQGIVTARQSPSGTPLILHTAAVSGGNSGGPLVDQCGRVVGMNTFIRTEKDQAARMNYALATDALATFLASAGVQVTVASDVCRPNRLGASP